MKWLWRNGGKGESGFSAFAMRRDDIIFYGILIILVLLGGLVLVDGYLFFTMVVNRNPGVTGVSFRGQFSSDEFEQAILLLNEREKQYLELLSGEPSRGATSLATSTQALAAWGAVLARESQGIVVTSLDVAKDGAVQIVGTAETKQNLANFERRLRSLPYFESLSPAEHDALQLTDFPFSIRGKVKAIYATQLSQE